MVIVTCLNCGIKFNKWPANIKRSKTNFCSAKCRRNFRKGKTYEERFGVKKAKEWKKRMSLAKKGKTHEEIFGKEGAEERKRIIKEKVHPLQIGRPRLDIIEKWKKARTPYDYNITPRELQKLRKLGQYKSWRKEVLKRDDYTCVKCNSKENVETDHIIPIFENKYLMLDVDNGQVLCKKCHRIKSNKELKRWLKREALQNLQ